MEQGLGGERKGGDGGNGEIGECGGNGEVGALRSDIFYSDGD